MVIIVAAFAIGLLAPVVFSAVSESRYAYNYLPGNLVSGIAISYATDENMIFCILASLLGWVVYSTIRSCLSGGYRLGL